jgi:farnesol dehydrogenase
MRVLVTGGTGYLGRALVDALVAGGHELVVFARRASESGLPGTLIDGDIRDGAAVDAAMDGCGAVCHAAALVAIWRRDPREFDDVNVGGLRNVLSAARRRRVGRVVYTSSFLALPPRGSPSPLTANDYQRTKVAARAVAIEAIAAGDPVVCLFPGVIYGPGVRTPGNLVGGLVADALARRLPGLVGPERTWSYSYVKDVAAGHVAALRSRLPRAEYGVGGPNLPQRRVFELLREARGVGIPPRIPYALASMIGAVEELRARLSGRLPLVTRGAVEIFRHDWPVDSSAAVEDLDYRVTPLDEGFRAVLAGLGDTSATGPR